MAETSDSYAYRCTPLNIANDYGWAALNPAQFTATWNGLESVDAISVIYEDDGEHDFAQSHFGHGILTIGVDFLLQTPKGVSTYIRGIPNETIDGLQPLDGIVETDWLPFTFTYNYKFTRPCTVRFYKDDPLFAFFPINRGEIEGYKISQRSIFEDQDLYKKYEEYAMARDSYFKHPEQVPANFKGQLYYSNAKTPKGERYNAENHTKKVKLNKVDE